MRYREFIEDSDGRGSASRLNMILGVIIGSIINMLLAMKGSLGWEIFGIYMGATGGIYGIGKWGDTKAQIEQIRAGTTSSSTKTVIRVKKQKIIDPDIPNQYD